MASEITLNFFLRKKYYLCPECVCWLLYFYLLKQIFAKQVLNAILYWIICLSFFFHLTIFLPQQCTSSQEYCVVSELYFKLQVFPTAVRYSLELGSKPKVWAGKTFGRVKPFYLIFLSNDFLHWMLRNLWILANRTLKLNL